MTQIGRIFTDLFFNSLYERIITTETQRTRSFIEKFSVLLRASVVMYFIFHHSFSSATAQNRILDSLNSILATTTHDTTRAATLLALSEELAASNPDTVILLGKQALALIDRQPVSLRQANNVRTTKADALNNIGYIYIYRDSIKNKENEKAAIRQQTKYEFEKAMLVAEQKEKERQRQWQVAVARRNMLENSAISIGIFILFGVIFFLGRFRLNEKVVDFLVFIPFLLLFEFVLVLLDPYIETFTGGEPALKLLINAVVAGVIFPVHGFFERVLKRRLLKK